MSESFRLSAVIPASLQRVYRAWLSGEEHGAMTGSTATGQAKVSARFTAWDGYIEGMNLEMEPYRRVVQSWRTSEFPEGSPDSRLEVLLEEAKGGTKVTLVHTSIPDGQGASYKQGWRDFYFTPMKRYFASARNKKATSKRA